jgi:5-formyltetrahydrofolate cyclo-ligase
MSQLGARVLLPAVRPGHVLEWAVGMDGLVQGSFGLLEPPGPFLGPTALADVSLMLVPALAVDGRGHRLGKGGGYYDRLLSTLARTVRLVAVVYDDEVLGEVPVEAHDRPVDGVLTESGLRWFEPR